MTIEFKDAAPVKVTGTGRTAEDNPFTAVIKEIALVTDKEGKPVAKSFTLTHEGTDDARKKAVAKVKRQTSKAGELNTPAVTVYVNAVPAKTGPKGREKDSTTDTIITFWTVTRQTRERKPKADATTPVTPAVASTPQSVAVASA